MTSENTPKKPPAYVLALIAKARKSQEEKAAKKVTLSARFRRRNRDG